MYLAHLSLTDFRSYPQLELPLEPGVTVLVGSNGVGKTNVMEAIGYLSTLGSHRVSSDQPLLRFGAEQAFIRARLVRGEQQASVEVEINAARANRARINRGNPVRARDILGLVRSVLFAPEDLALVKGEPAIRRRFLDELLVTLEPRHAGTRADYDRVLKQRNALLKSARGGRLSSAQEATLDVWDHHLATRGAELLHARLALVRSLQPHIDTAYASLTDGSKIARAHYRSTVAFETEEGGAGLLLAPAAADDDGGPAVVGIPAVEDDAARLAGDDIARLTERYLLALKASRQQEADRGLTLVGPHREEWELLLGQAPAKGFASHGETWSFALSLRLAAYYALLEDDLSGTQAPILILDDVFAELDAQRRARLATIVATAEQVLVTAAVDSDVPPELAGSRVRVLPGTILPGAGDGA
ncbi:DNA replication and repair protein RecF [Arthrobacter woluwensis]|uniref:DNA replication/repair protein RecF n=1 Tax=Arthrobacter woluwensis TaxID=156980 RepID=UPI00278441A1|nr:DNA replication/repair protein RecF [Arthrobacter woluwensis]MDQ0710380.1 DNA replication and repair protein RecF [Arthrobacter woluwensis]